MKKYLWIVLLLSVNAVHSMHGPDEFVDFSNHENEASGTSDHGGSQGLNEDDDEYSGFGTNHQLAHEESFDGSYDFGGNTQSNVQIQPIQSEAGDVENNGVNATAGVSSSTQENVESHDFSRGLNLDLVARESVLRGIGKGKLTQEGKNKYRLSIPREDFNDHLRGLVKDLFSSGNRKDRKHIEQLIDTAPEGSVDDDIQNNVDPIRSEYYGHYKDTYRYGDLKRSKEKALQRVERKYRRKFNYGMRHYATESQPAVSLKVPLEHQFAIDQTEAKYREKHRRAFKKWQKDQLEKYGSWNNYDYAFQMDSDEYQDWKDETTSYGSGGNFSGPSKPSNGPPPGYNKMSNGTYKKGAVRWRG